MIPILFAAMVYAKLAFDPPSLKLSDASLEHTYNVKLDTKPEGPVSVYFTAPGLYFSECVLEFTPENYDQVKPIKVNGVPEFESATTKSYNITAREFTEPAKYTDVTYSVEREIVPAGSFEAVGDPHYKTLDGFSYTRMGKGYYSVFEHPDMSIHAFQAIYKGSATVHHAVAVRFGSSIFALDLRGMDFKKGKFPETLTEITPNSDGVVYSPPTKKNPKHVLTGPGGTKITLTPKKNSINKYININANIAAGFLQNGGLSNIKNADGKLQMKSGEMVDRSELDAFYDSWKLDEAETLFKGVFPEVITPAGFVENKCTIPDQVAPPPPVYIAPVIPAYTAPAPEPDPVEEVLPALPDTFDAECTKFCTDLFANICCESLVPVQFSIDACIADAKATGSYAFAETIKEEYFESCLSKTEFLIDNSSGEDTARGLKIQQDCGLGEATCVNDCSNNGECTYGGCVCNAGFTGTDCSEDMAALTALNPDTNTFTTDCPKKVYSEPEVALPADPIPEPAAVAKPVGKYVTTADILPTVPTVPAPVAPVKPKYETAEVKPASVGSTYGEAVAPIVSSASTASFSMIAVAVAFAL